MPNRSEYQQLALRKIEEAKALHAAGFYEGSHYMAGYVLEFSLKAAVCKHLDIDDFFDGTHVNDVIRRSYKTHSYTDLIVLAGLKNKFDTYKSTNRLAGTNWSFIESTTMKWSEQCRYMVRTQINELTAGDVQKYIDALDDKPGGFLEWIKTYW